MPATSSMGLIGRKRELDFIRARFESAKQSFGSIVFCQGEVGSGLSRFVQEAARIAVSEGFLVARVVAKLAGQKPYEAMLQPLRSLQEQYLARVRGGSGGGNLGDELDAALPVSLIPLADTSSRSREFAETSELSAEMGRIFNTALNLMREILEDYPVMVVLEEFHRADVASMRLLNYLGQNLRASRFLAVVTYRPEEVATAEGRTHPLVEVMQKMSLDKLCDELTLGRLSPSDTATLVREMLGVDKVPESVAKMMHIETEGNPGLVAQIVKELTKTYGSDWFDRPVSQLKFPPLAKAAKEVFVKRLGQLAKDSRKVIQSASVIGPEFDFNTLVCVAGVPEDTVLDALDEAASLDIVRELKEREGEVYLFNHKHFWQTALEGVPRPELVKLHLAIARTYAARHSKDVGGFASVIANHCREGGDLKAAFEYYLASGDAAARNFAPDDAGSGYRAAAAVADEAIEAGKEEAPGMFSGAEAIKAKMHALDSLGAVYYGLGEWDPASGVYLELLSLATDSEDWNIRSKSLRRLGHIQRHKGNFGEALHMYEESKKFAQMAGNLHAEAAADRGLATVAWREGDNPLAIELFTRAMEIAATIKDDALLGLIKLELGNVYNTSGDWQIALDYYEGACQTLLAVGELTEVARAHNNIGDLYLQLDDYESAMESFKKCAEFAKKAGNCNFLSWAAVNEAQVYAMTGNVEKAMESCREFSRICARIGNPFGSARVFRALGIVHRVKKEYAESIKQHKASIQTLKELGIPYETARGYIELAHTYLDARQKREAIANLKNAASISSKIGAKGLFERAARELDRAYAM